MVMVIAMANGRFIHLCPLLKTQVRGSWLYLLSGNAGREAHMLLQEYGWFQMMNHAVLEYCKKQCSPSSVATCGPNRYLALKN